MLSLPSAKAIQAGATIVLVAITAWYAYQTKRSSDLFRRQLDLEERRKHADVLQERIDRWLDSFPEVKTTEIRQFEIASEGVDFAIPSWLRNDPYLEDLLENHVPELQNRIDRIQDKYSEFCGLRKKYIYDINSTNIQSDERSIEVLDEAYAEWLFDIAIKLQRGDKNKEEIKSNIEHSFSEKSPKKEDKFLLRPDPNQSKSIMEFYYKRSTAQRREDQ